MQSDIEKLEKVRTEILLTGYASASISSQGGSKFYTRLDVEKITKAIAEMSRSLQGCRRMLVGETSGMPKQIYTVYC